MVAGFKLDEDFSLGPSSSYGQLPMYSSSSLMDDDDILPPPDFGDSFNLPPPDLPPAELPPWDMPDLPPADLPPVDLPPLDKPFPPPIMASSPPSPNGLATSYANTMPMEVEAGRFSFYATGDFPLPSEFPFDDGAVKSAATANKQPLTLNTKKDKKSEKADKKKSKEKEKEEKKRLKEGKKKEKAEKKEAEARRRKMTPQELIVEEEMRIQREYEERTKKLKSSSGHQDSYDHKEKRLSVRGK